IERSDAVEIRRDDLARRNRAAHEELRKLGEGEPVQVVHHFCRCEFIRTRRNMARRGRMNSALRPPPNMARRGRMSSTLRLPPSGFPANSFALNTARAPPRPARAALSLPA